MMIKNQWNVLHEISNYLDINHYKYTYELDL